MPAQYVKPYVKTNKSDFIDAEAVAEAVYCNSAADHTYRYRHTVRLLDSHECQLRYNPHDMKGKTLNIAITGVVCLTAILLSNRLGLLNGQEAKVPGSGFAAVPGQKGGQDVFGPYDPVQNWEKPLAESLPELKGWTF